MEIGRMRIGVLIGHLGKDSGALDPKNPAEGDEIDTREDQLNAFLSGPTASVLGSVCAGADLISGGFNDRLSRLVECEAAIELHTDSGPPEAHGHSVLVSSARNAEEGKEHMRLAECLKAELMMALPNFSRGVVPRPGDGGGNLLILNKAPCPIVIVEAGFITNPAEERMLWTRAFAYRLACGITLGMIRWAEGR